MLIVHKHNTTAANDRLPTLRERSLVPKERTPFPNAKRTHASWRVSVGTGSCTVVVLRCELTTIHSHHFFYGGTKGRRPMRLLRWADSFSEYQFDEVYRPGADNAVADLRLRSEAEPQHESNQQTANLTDIFIRTVFSNAALDGLNLKEVAEATAADNKLSIVVKHSINGWIPADRRNPIIGIYNKLADELSVAKGVPFCGDQAVIFTSLRQQDIQLAHKGHSSIVKMRKRYRDCVW